MKFLRNLLYIFTSDIISKIVGFVSTAYLARKLLPENFGLFHFSLAIVSYFLLPVRLGFSDYGIIKISPERTIENIKKILGEVLLIRISIAVISYLLLIIASIYLTKLKHIEEVLLILGLLAFSRAFTIDWLYTALEKFKYVAIAKTATNLFYLILIYILVKDQNDIINTVLVSLFKEYLFSFILILWAYNYIKNLNINYKINDLINILKYIFPFAISGLAAQMYYNIDVLILGFLKSTEDVGYYTAALRLLMFGVNVKLLLGQLFYPKIIKQLNYSNLDFKKITLIIEKYIIIIGIFFGVSGFLLAGEIIKIVYGNKYLLSIAPLKIGVWVVTFELIGIVFPYALIYKYKILYSKIILTTMIINILLNLLFIYHIGIIGAAISYLLSSIFLNFVCFYYVNKKIINLEINKLFIKPIIAIAIMLIVFYNLNTNIIIAYLISSSLFFLFLYFQGINLKSLKLEIDGFKKI